MSSDPLARLLLVGLTTIAVLGCTAAAPPSSPPTASRSEVPAPTTARASAPADTSPESLERPPAAWLLVGRRDEAVLHLLMSTTGEVDPMAIPAGAPSTNWERVVSATIDGAATVVRDAIVQPGSGGPELRIDDHWRLPMVGLDPVPAGRSLDGSTIVLIERAYDPAAVRTRFAIVEHFLLGTVQTAGDAPLRLARIIDLPGAFEYDTLSPDGRILYLVEHLDGVAGGHYQVRAVDVGTGVLRDGVIVDKTHPEESMAGSPIAQVRRNDGVVLTLYRGPQRPFIHALNSKDAWAVCIDLPPGASNDEAASLDWGMASSANGSSVYAVDASLGIAVDVDPAGLAVRRSASIGTIASTEIVLAKFGHSDPGPVGRRVILSPDGTTLFAAGADGIAVIRTGDLVVIRRDLPGSSIEALGITPDGATLFAVLHGSGRIVGIDATTGRRLGTVPGDGYDRLLAVTPW